MHSVMHPPSHAPGCQGAKPSRPRRPRPGARSPPLPQPPVEAPVLDRLGDVGGGEVPGAGEVGQGAGDLQDPVDRPRREAEALEGGVEGRPDNVIFYATSNRRHLLPRDMIDNERSTAINPSEAVEEKVSLSDRFGLWLGFHKCSQDEYLDMIDGYVRYHDLKIDPETLRAEALEWATTRGSRSW